MHIQYYSHMDTSTQLLHISFAHTFLHTKFQFDSFVCWRPNFNDYDRMTKIKEKKKNKNDLNINNNSLISSTLTLCLCSL